MDQIRNHSRQWIIATVVILLLAVGVYQLWTLWPTLVLESIQWQRSVNEQLADLLYETKAEPITAGAYLIGFSFLYGMLHSLGPGHGKVIVSTYLATHPTKVKASLVLTVVSAICQALVAISLVSILLWGFNASMKVVNEKAATFVALSFALVAVMGVMLCWKAMKRIYQTTQQSKVKVKAISPVSGAAMSLNTSKISAVKPINAQPMISNQTPHVHSATCGCGHQHVAGADEINNASTLREYMAIVLTIGIRPCTGAIMVLLFANIVDMYWMGVVGALAMAGGTALTTSTIAIMTLTGKHIVKRYLTAGAKKDNDSMKIAGHYAQLFGGVLLIVIGLLLMSGQDAGMSPVFSI